VAIDRLGLDAPVSGASGAEVEARDLSLPPHNLDAEEAVLGSVLKSPQSIVRVSDFLRAEDFYAPRHKHIYQAMLSLAAQPRPIDYHTVADELQQLGLYEAAGGLLYLSELNVATPTSAHIEFYGHVVERTAIMRRLISASQTIAEIAYRDNLDPDTALEKAEQLILSIAERRVTRDFRSLEDVLHEYMEQVEAITEGEGVRYGIPSGYTDLDKLLGGFQRTDLVILAARTSVGKTSFALNLAVNASMKAKATVAIFSLEMAAEQLASRLLSMESGVDSPRIRSGQLNDQETRKVDHALNFLVQAPIWVDDTPSIPIMELRSKARRLAAEQGVDLIVVDYLQLIAAERGENRVQELGQVSRALKALARELRVPIIALSQLSRAVEQRSPHIPQLSDLRESGCITGDTPVYLPDESIYRPISELSGSSGFRVLALNTHTWKLEPRVAEKTFPTGRKAVFRLRTRTGRSVRATANHRFLTTLGWRRLDELQPGMRIALPRLLPGIGVRTMSDAELALLGHLIGDGCTLRRHAIQYTTADPGTAQIVADLAVEAFGAAVSPRIQRDRTWYQVYLAASRRLTHGIRNPVAAWLSDLGAFGLRSYEKHVPRVVFAQPVDGVTVFLRHLWATDGCINLPRTGRRHYPKIYYATSSQRLAADVQSLLLRLSITARLGVVTQAGKGRDQYRVLVSGKPDIERFLDQVGVLDHYRGSQKAAIVQLLTASGAKTGLDVLPREVWDAIIRPAMTSAGTTRRQLTYALTYAYPEATLFNLNRSRDRASRIAEVVGCGELAKLANGDIYWDPVDSIQPDGEDDVFDLTVGEHHNFVASDIVLHNSIEQDADVVLFIYRDEKYNPDTDKKGVADIIVAKHRNGPTGQVQLLFLERTTKFLDLEVFRA
jgi:replicative DNA helicase